jgi:hypothetical protein
LVFRVFYLGTNGQLTDNEIVVNMLKLIEETNLSSTISIRSRDVMFRDPSLKVRVDLHYQKLLQVKRNFYASPAAKACITLM